MSLPPRRDILHNDVIINKMITVLELRKKRGNICECCGINQGVERHHCLFHRRKGKNEFDNEYNLCLVCKPCHDNVVNGFEFKQTFWRMQTMRYPDFIDWYESVSTKSVKERYE
jgi:hypothetical protein